MKSKDKNSPQGRSYWQALNASSAGLVFFLSIVVGAGIGYYLDKFFGTKPYLLLFFLVMGIIAGFRNMWQFIKKSQENIDTADKDKGK